MKLAIIDSRKANDNGPEAARCVPCARNEGVIDMTCTDEIAYITEAEAAQRLDISQDELFMLVLESARPKHVSRDGEILYLASDVELMRATVVA
jgi:hypothetical protein